MLNVKSIAKTTSLVLLGAILFIIPDILYSFANSSYKIVSVFKIFNLLFLLSLGLVLCRRWVLFLTLGFLFILQFMQFSKIDYFGRPLVPYDFVAMIDEWYDVVQEAGDVAFSHWNIILIVVIPFALMYWVFLKQTKRTIIGDIKVIKDPLRKTVKCVTRVRKNADK